MAERLEQPIFAWGHTFSMGMRALVAGDTDRAEELATQALQIGADSGQPDAAIIFGAQLMNVTGQRGTMKELIPLIEQMASDTPDISPWLFGSLLAKAHVEAGRFDEATEKLEEFALRVATAQLDQVLAHRHGRLRRGGDRMRGDVRFAQAVGAARAICRTASRDQRIGAAPRQRTSAAFAAVLGRYGAADEYLTQSAGMSARLRAKFFAAGPISCATGMSRPRCSGRRRAGSGAAHPCSWRGGEARTRTCSARGREVDPGLPAWNDALQRWSRRRPRHPNTKPSLESVTDRSNVSRLCVAIRFRAQVSRVSGRLAFWRLGVDEVPENVSEADRNNPARSPAVMRRPPACIVLAAALVGGCSSFGSNSSASTPNTVPIGTMAAAEHRVRARRRPVDEPGPYMPAVRALAHRGADVHELLRDRLALLPEPRRSSRAAAAPDSASSRTAVATAGTARSTRHRDGARTAVRSTERIPHRPDGKYLNGYKPWLRGGYRASVRAPRLERMGRHPNGYDEGTTTP